MLSNRIHMRFGRRFGVNEWAERLKGLLRESAEQPDNSIADFAWKAKRF